MALEEWKLRLTSVKVEVEFQKVGIGMPRLPISVTCNKSATVGSFDLQEIL